MCGDGLEGVKQDARGHQLLLGVLIGFGLILPLVILLPVSQADSIDRETEKALVVLTCLLPSVAAILAAVFVFSTATPFRRRWVLGLIIGLLTLPTFLFLPILVLERPGPDAQAALIFLALIPHVVLALVWTLLELLGDTIFDDFMDDERRRFFRAAAVVVGAVMMVLLICVLIPVHQEADINHNPRDMLLVMIFLNLVLWIPLMLGTLSADFPRGDFLMWYLGYFVSISLPFATFLPILFTGDHSNNGQSTLITFAVSSLVIGFTFLLGPRIADKVATSIYDPPSTPDEEDIYERKQTLLELGFGLGLIAVLVLLVLTPVHEEATLGKEPRRTIFALILILLVYAIVYAPVRFFGCTGTRTEQAVFGLGAFFLIALPLLILLPITLEDSHSDSGLAALIFFMLFPWLAFIGLLIYLALTDDPTLVFRPIDLLPCSDCNYSVAKYIYAAAVLLFPVVLLLPIYFEADLHSLPRDMLLFFVIAIPTLCAVLFFIAFLMEPEETANLDDLGWDHSASVVSLPVPSNVSAPDDSHHNGTGNGTGNGAGHNNQVGKCMKGWGDCLSSSSLLICLCCVTGCGASSSAGGLPGTRRWQ